MKKAAVILLVVFFQLNLRGQESPMGKTWVVFIENSNYTFFPSISTPTQDVNQIKSVLENYQIDKILHKKNVTLTQLKYFFETELSQLVVNNNVNSILIWYAGHGKVINATSYWIPVDAKRDNENTFYDITNLKSALKSYSINLSHVLLITDACESGPSFYHAMRSLNTDQKCDDPQAIHSKSSQILTSSGYRYGFEESVFTQTFAKTLMNSTSSCIPIDQIAVEISKIAVQNNQNKPQFGKISDMQDENGTFFFIRK